MKRIYKAINEGLDKSLIDFDDDGDFKKSTPHHDFKNFNFGDYVYKDLELGYNNYIGEKVAICVSDEPNKELYAVLDHPLLTSRVSWARVRSKLERESVPDFGNGWENTLYILANYRKRILDGSIWAMINPENEYIPTGEELMTIYNNCKNTPIWNEIGLLEESSYWTSTHSDRNREMAFFINMLMGFSAFAYKVNGFRAVVLLHIN